MVVKTAIKTAAVLAISADGKIADGQRSAARFASAADQWHLSVRLAEADAAVFGAGTLRAYQTTLPIADDTLLRSRQQQGKSPQPVHIVCSASGKLDPSWRFFSQPVPRWLLTTPQGKQGWAKPHFDCVLPLLPAPWAEVWQVFAELGLRHVLVLGGGELMADLVQADLIDDLWLTVCPLLIGGQSAPTPLDGAGFAIAQAPKLQLISVKAQADEVFLHYRRLRSAAKVHFQDPR